jgi:hypothetical protein
MQPLVLLLVLLGAATAQVYNYTTTYYADSSCLVPVANSTTLFTSGACLADPITAGRSASFTYFNSTFYNVLGYASSTTCVGSMLHVVLVVAVIGGGVVVVVAGRGGWWAVGCGWWWSAC